MAENTPSENSAVDEAEIILRENSPVKIILDAGFARQLESYFASRVYGPPEIRRLKNEGADEQNKAEVRITYEDLVDKLISSIGNEKEGMVMLKITPRQIDLLLADLMNIALNYAYKDSRNKTTGELLKTLATAYQHAGGNIKSESIKKFIAK